MSAIYHIRQCQIYKQNRTDNLHLKPESCSQKGNNTSTVDPRHKSVPQEQAPVSLWRHLASIFVSHHVTEGLAKINGFEVLRHGTSIPKYVNILKNGVNPSMGGKGIGNINHSKNEDRQKMRGCWHTFHMYKDSDNTSPERGALRSHFIKRIGPHMHAMLTSIGEVAHLSKPIPLAPFRYLIGAITGIFWGVINLIFSPTLRFMYRKDEIGRISENDPYYWDLAIRTFNGLEADDFCELVRKNHGGLAAEFLDTMMENGGYLTEDNFKDLKKKYPNDYEKIIDCYKDCREVFSEYANALSRTQTAIEDNKRPISLPNHRIGCIGLWRHANKIDRETAWQKDKMTVVAGYVQCFVGILITGIGLGWLL